MRKRLTEDEIVRILREAEASQMPIRDLSRKHYITERTSLAGATSAAAWWPSRRLEGVHRARGVAEVWR
jgi:hypothetical protein